ncbi:MAG: manganese efflux pump MntP family protein [Oscillospiraceae bacterium]|jgi:putative Mn2+ efflux pump MntP|nr:manganese efflux pump MntP family protein [Oscillospiraceae bacterium]
MGMGELLLIAAGLAMDAFAVAIGKGLNMRRINYKHCALIALFFGVFQGLMPLIGWVLGTQFAAYIQPIDHWVAFVLLGFIGGKMLWEAFRGEDEDKTDNLDELNIKELLVLSVATSIDALAAGISFALLLNNGQIAYAVIIIGVVTFLLSFAGVIIGNNFGSRFKKSAEVAGGCILILMGAKILIEHLLF